MADRVTRSMQSGIEKSFCRSVFDCGCEDVKMLGGVYSTAIGPRDPRW